MSDVPGVIERVRLGATKVEVTRFVLGCAPIGGLYEEVTDADAEAALETAWRLGVRAFDTAPHYGAGRSERRVGAFLADRERRDVVVSTKVGRLIVAADLTAGDGPAPEFAGESPLVRVRDYSAVGVRRSLEESLERLGIDRVDIALVHDPELHLDQVIAESLPTLVGLRDEGVIGAVGAGMNLCRPLERVVAEADVDCVLVAGRYSLLDQEAARRLLPECQRRDVAVLVGGVFNSEVLVNPRPGAHYEYEVAPPAIIERSQRIGALCARFGVPLGAAAVQFPLRHPAVTAVVVGARTAHEVAEDLGFFSAVVPEELFAELDASGLVEEGHPL